MVAVTEILPDWAHYYRIIASRFPPINVFESILDPADLETAFYIESLTNDRLIEQAGDITQVPASDRIAGPGSSTVMAAFTHIGWPSRFTDGSYGVLYAASTELGAIRETMFHTERFLGDTGEPACTVEKRLYVGEISESLVDIRGGSYAHLAEPEIETYPLCQAFAVHHKQADAWGLLYPSVRHAESECAAVFRPNAVSIPRQAKHFQYRWNGQHIADVLQVREVAH